MAIQLRRGAYANFDPAKMLPAEVGVVTSGDPGTVDGKAAYVAFAAGNVKKLATVDDIAAEIDGAVDEAVQRAEDVAESIEASAAQIETNRTDIADLKEEIVHAGISDSVKTALLSCFLHVAWSDEHGQDYYDALEEALYADTGLASISATFNQGSSVIYTDNTLNDLKQYLTVTAHYKDGTSGVIDNYTLSGSLDIGRNTITVSYKNKSATFIAEAVMRFSTILGAPSNTSGVGFQYVVASSTPVRACNNPVAFSLPVGTYDIEWSSSASNYYYSIAALKYDESEYPNIDYTIQEPRQTKTFLPSGAYTIEWFMNGWKNETMRKEIPSNYTKLFANFKKGSAGTDILTESDLAILNTCIIRRIY